MQSWTRRPRRGRWERAGGLWPEGRNGGRLIRGPRASPVTARRFLLRAAWCDGPAMSGGGPVGGGGDGLRGRGGERRGGQPAGPGAGLGGQRPAVSGGPLDGADRVAAHRTRGTCMARPDWPPGPRPAASRTAQHRQHRRPPAPCPRSPDPPAALPPLHLLPTNSGRFALSPAGPASADPRGLGGIAAGPSGEALAAPPAVGNGKHGRWCRPARRATEQAPTRGRRMGRVFVCPLVADGGPSVALGSSAIDVATVLGCWSRRPGHGARSTPQTGSSILFRAHHPLGRRCGRETPPPADWRLFLKHGSRPCSLLLARPSLTDLAGNLPLARTPVLDGPLHPRGLNRNLGAYLVGAWWREAGDPFGGVPYHLQPDIALSHLGSPLDAPSVWSPWLAAIISSM
jgi:hypothetical protein